MAFWRIVVTIFRHESRKRSRKHDDQYDKDGARQLLRRFTR